MRDMNVLTVYRIKLFQIKQNQQLKPLVLPYFLVDHIFGTTTWKLMKIQYSTIFSFVS